MHEHEIDVRVAFGDLVEFGDEERVAGDVDAVAAVEAGVVIGGGFGSELEHPAVRGWDL